MTNLSKYKFLASVLQRIFASDEDRTPASIAPEVGYRTPHIVESWVDGASLPDLPRLIALANAIHWPVDDLLLAWLADLAPQYLRRIKIIASQLIGTRAADDLLSSAPAEEGTSWLNVTGEPMTAAEVVIEMGDMSDGVFRHNRR